MPRAGLNEDRVVEEAAILADEVGLSKITLTSLAERLGVRQPSLYKHVDGLTGLERGIAIRAKRELADVLARAAVGRSGGDAIESMSRAYRTWALEHPGRYEAAQRAPLHGDTDDEAASLAAVQILADILAGFQLQGDDVIHAIRAMRAALHGFVSLESAGGFAIPLDINLSFDRLIRGLITAFENWAAQ